MRRLPLALVAAAVLLLVLAPAGLASDFDAGEGWYGETNDKAITTAGFILVAAFPLLAFLLSMLQMALDKRKDRRKQAAKARAVRPEWHGGW